MRTLNLTNPDKSDIEYKISKFPDGQQDVTITWNLTPKLKEVEIISHLNGFKDLELVLCATAALRNMNVNKIHLKTPYLLGARSDRQFVRGGTSYVRDIIAPILNKQKYKSVTCWDVHSDVSAGVIKKLNIISNIPLVQFALKEIDTKNYILLSPDGGSLKKIYKVVDYINYKDEVIVCSKSRDTEGKLTKTVVPMGQLWNSTKNILIIDDICSGGRTFTNISTELKNNGYKGNIYLIVTHYENTADIEKLKQYFTKIYCTNSICDVQNDFIKQLNVY